MPYNVTFPKSNDQAEQTVKFILKEGKAKRAAQAIRWWICRYYMRGCRNFSNLNYTTGEIQVSYYDEKGVLNFLYEDIVSKYQAQRGRLMGLNLTPVVTKEGISLDGMRKASVGQVVLDSIFPAPKVSSVQREAINTLLLYGTTALIPWVIDADSIGIEVVPPWEIIPIPIEVDSPAVIKGLARVKMVPLEWVKELPNTREKKAKIYKDMDTIEVPVGLIPQDEKERFQGSVAIGISGSTAYTTMETKAGGSGRAGRQSADKTKVKVVEVAEIWTKTPDGYWDEYMLYAGGKLLDRRNYKQERRQFPAQVISDVEIGNFWGRSFVDTLIPINCEMEEAIARQFQNLKDWDLYGILMEPTTTGVVARITRGKDGVKRARYEPDPVAPDHKPYNISPSNTGTLPSEIVKLGVALQNNIANQPTELMGGGAPGRVDSSSGLGFLYETSNVPITPTAKVLAEGFSNCYRVILDIARLMWDDKKVLDITHLDDTVAGIQIDPSTGKLRLTENAIPHPDEIVISVASAVPRSKEQQKIELKDALKGGVITPTEYNIKVRKMSLDLPVGNEIEWQNYRRATLENLILFNDGRIPGNITFSERDMHQVHLMVLDAFMARPEFYLTSSEVRKKFVEHREEHLNGMGQYPDMMPYGEEAAEESVAQIDEVKRLLEREPMAGAGAVGGEEMPVM